MSETTFEQRIRDQHAADPKSMMFAGHAIIALDELRSQLAAERQLKEAAEAKWRDVERFVANDEVRLQAIITSTEAKLTAAEARAARLEEELARIREDGHKLQGVWNSRSLNERAFGVDPGKDLSWRCGKELAALLALAAEEGAGDAQL